MSEKLCELRKKGGGGQQYTETSLWTNSSPSSAFSGQDVTLSESIDNFKYIAVKYKATTTSTSDSQMGTVIYKAEDIKKATSPSAALQPVGAFGNLNANNTNYFYRYIVYKGSTTLYLSNSYSINASGNNTSLAIPLEILGLNELDHGTKYITNFVAMYSGSGLSGTTSIASRGYITDNASDGDTISAGAAEYFTEQSVSGTSGYVKVYAAKDLDAMVIEGYATVTYKNRHFSQGDLIGTINRSVSNTLWIGVYE